MLTLIYIFVHGERILMAKKNSDVSVCVTRGKLWDFVDVPVFEMIFSSMQMLFGPKNLTDFNSTLICGHMFSIFWEFMLSISRNL